MTARGNVAADLLVHVGADIKDATTGLDNVGNKVDSTTKNMRKTSMAMGGMALGVLGFLGGATMAAANFEQGMANINAVADLTAQQFDQLSDLALNIGAATSFSATEGAQAIEELVKAGVSVDDVLSGAAMSAAQLAEAGGVGIPEAATIMANSMNLFGIAGSDAARVADVFAAAANASAADVDTLSQALKQGGPAAAMMGMSLEDTVAALALFSNYGIQGSDAGTSLKTMLQSLSNPSAEAAAKMQELGINAFDASGNFVGMENLAGQLQTSLSGLTEEQRNAALAMIFGADASRVAGILFKAGAGGVKEMTDATSEQGAAAKMAQARMNTLQGAIEQLKGSVETAMIMLGSTFVPILRGVADALTDAVNWVSSIPAPMQKFIGMAVGAAGALLGLGAAITGLIGFGGPAIAGLMAILNPIGLLVAAAIGLYIAWRKNFFGIRDATAAVTRPLGKAFDMLLGYFSDVVRGQRVLTDSLNAFPEPLRGIIMILGAAVDGVADFIRVISGGGSLREAWADLTDTFMKKPVKDAIGGLGGDLMSGINAIPWGDVGNALWEAFKAGLGVLRDAAGWIVSNLGDLAGKLWEWFSAAVTGVDWGAVWQTAMAWASSATGWILDKLGDLAGKLWDWATAAFSAIPWGTIADWIVDQTGTIAGKLGDLVKALSDWATNAFKAIPWTTIVNWISDQTGAIASKLGNLSLALGRWAVGAFQNINWGFITNNVPNVVGTIVSKLGDFGMGLKHWYDNAINSVDWGNLGETLGTWIRTTVVPKAGELISGFTTWLSTHWIDVAKVLGGLIIGLPATIGYIGMTLAPKAVEFMGGFLKGLTGKSWGDIGRWLLMLPVKLVAAIPSLLQTLVQKGVQLMVGLIQGLIDYWPTIKTWLGTLGTLAVGAVGNLSEYLLVRGLQLFSGLYRGVINYWNQSVKPWLAGLGPRAVSAIGGLAETLMAKGNQLMNGMKSGIKSTWENVIEGQWLSQLGSKAVSIIPDLSNTLFNAGWSLMRGFYNGILDQWNAVKDLVGGMKKWIEDHKGPIEDDRVLLIGHGAAMMTGFMEGLQSVMPRIESMLADFTESMPNSFGVDASLAMAGAGQGVMTNTMANPVSQSLAKVQGTGQNTVVQQIHIDAHFDDVEDMIRAAEFVKTLNTSADMYISGLEQ